jgi:hypothetical protein
VCTHSSYGLSEVCQSSSQIKDIKNVLALGKRMEKTYHFWAAWCCKEEFRYIVDEALEFYPMPPLFLRKVGCQLSDGKCLAH